jgi:hypothetical protein
VVDPSGGGTHTTIRAAADVATVGDTILIHGITSGGLPTGYSESHIGGGESFPITIQPGVTVKPFSAQDIVMVWTNGTSTPSELFRILGTNAQPQAAVRIEDLQFYGGACAIRFFDHDPLSGTSFNFVRGVIARCEFAWQTLAIDCQVENSTLATIAVRDSRIHSIKVIPSSQNDSPNYVAPSVGIRLHAKEGSSPSLGKNPARVDAEIRNLRTAGAFESMAQTGLAIPSYAALENFTAQFPASEFTRLIEVYAEDFGTFKEHSLPSPFAPIPQVNVLMLGGDCEGASSSNPSFQQAGWDVGLFCSAGWSNSGSLDEPLDFCAGYHVETSGTKLTGFRYAGIYASSGIFTRGTIELGSGTLVAETGRQASRTVDTNTYSGVHMYLDEGYLGLLADSATVRDNTGEGIFLHTKNTLQKSDMASPSGNYLDVKNCALYGNDGNGIAMRILTDGIVGGAWHFVNQTRTLLEVPGIDYSVAHGQGSIHNCSISSNGEAGMHFRVKGSTSAGSPTMANTRITNTIVWNNPLGAYLADLTGEDSAPYFLVPFAHCTFAGNGDGTNGDFTVWVEEEVGEDATYTWNGNGGTVSTKFFNSILERKSSSAVDFGPGMHAIGTASALLEDDSNILMTINQIGCSGLRYMPPSGGPLLDISIDEATPFVNASNWSTLDPTRFYLLNLGSSQKFGETPTYLPIPGNETNFDHSGDLRPPVTTGVRDKGAEEL